MNPSDSQPAAAPSEPSRRPRQSRLISALHRSLHDIRAAILVGAVCSTALGAGLAQALPSDPDDILPLSEVKPGMKGHGLTVFSGTTPERFDVEVISILKNFRPNMNLILVKTIHPRLEITRTVAGMSGSPIYLKGKMIGAYAYGWLFGVEPIAGVTPIQSMLEELNRPIPKGFLPGGSPMPSSKAAADPKVEMSPHAYAGAPDAYDLTAHAKQMAARTAPALSSPEGSQLARASTPVLMGGMGSVSMKIASDLLAPMGLEPLQAGGGSSKQPDKDAPTKFVDGGAIGVELLRGDISATGVGTVTRVSGTKLLAFGHPMMQGGISQMPTAIAHVHWILASHNRSFKISEAVRSMGTLVNDRQAAIVVDTTVKAPTFPMQIRFEGVEGAAHPIWNVDVALDQFTSPAFAAMAIGSAAETTTAERRDMTWRSVSRLKIARYGTLTLKDFGSGNGSPLGPDDFVRTRLVRAMGSLLNNPWEPVEVEKIETDIRVTFEREVSLLRSTAILSPEIDVGEKARIRMDIQPYQGKVESKIIEVEIPEELAGREVEIELAPGYEVDKPQATPNSVAELIAMLQNQNFDSESMVATIRLRENGAAFKGQVASRLPPFAIDTLRATSVSDAPETFGAQSVSVFPMQRFIVGRDSVRVKVRPPMR